MEIELRLLSVSELRGFSLGNFNRYQETTRVRYVENGQVLHKEDNFVDNWDGHKKDRIVRGLLDCVRAGGVVVGAFADKNLVGFASIQGRFFGSRQQYLELHYLHVSNEVRSRGVGKKLFKFCCTLAKQMGAAKLYIAAHPAEETQQFYQRMGCILALETNQEILEREPLDIQLEVCLE
jgi:predicted GNAT superfamily acetyltransferase